MSSVDEILKIERSVLLRAPRSRVWRALTRAQEFGKWFGVECEGEFAPGARLSMVTTQPEEYKGLCFPILVERMEPERLLSWRWHPGADLPDVEDPEKMTTVVFTLEEVEGGTRLTVLETGFDRVSVAKRAKAYEENSGGWEGQLKNIEAYVSREA